MTRRPHNFVDLTGQVFHRLTVLQWDHGKWLCQCACGKTPRVVTQHLRSGHTKSCGCYSRDRATKHGMHKSPEYIIYQQIKERCYNKRKASYARYGGRGIVMCDAWRESFDAFIADMGRRPSAGHTVEREDNDGPYSPENCRWVTWDVQYRNRRQTKWLEYDGVKLCRKDWSRKHGVDEATLAQRLDRGWDMHTALHAPPYYQFNRLGPLPRP